MRLRLRRSALVTFVVCALAAVAILLEPSAGSVQDTYPPNSTVGALFSLGESGQLGIHFCTASVVDSPAGDLVVTAAHCMKGRTPDEIAFVPDYSRGQEPFGVWTVSRIIVDASWTTSADPDDDFAFLIVHQKDAHGSVQQLTGGETVGIDVAAGRTVMVAGYPDGQDAPISCQGTALEYSSTQYQFDCDGFTDGTSGSPLLADVGPLGGSETVIGVIGGYEQGGYTPSVSYAAKFSANLSDLYQIALSEAGRLVPTVADLRLYPRVGAAR
jgi:V8-like Glu-specific endopeptidase